jgi:hypothetical protein
MKTIINALNIQHETIKILHEGLTRTIPGLDELEEYVKRVESYYQAAIEECEHMDSLF